jgi:HUS1 checkpoint protein
MRPHGLCRAGFLPAMDKVGRVCHVFFTPTHAMLLHNLLGATAAGPDGGGPQCVAQFAKDLLFREYNLSSRNGNQIAFSVEVALLHRALRSVLAVHAQPPAAGDAAGAPAIQVRLVNKLPAGSRTATPFLTFETKGAHAAVVQDVPISRPLSRSDVERLHAALDAAKDLPKVCSLHVSIFYSFVYHPMVPNHLSHGSGSPDQFGSNLNLMEVILIMHFLVGLFIVGWVN